MNMTLNMNAVGLQRTTLHNCQQLPPTAAVHQPTSGAYAHLCPPWHIHDDNVTI